MSLHFNLAFSQCSTSIYQAFHEQTEFSRVSNFAILSHLQNSRKFDARKKYVLQYIHTILGLSHWAAEARGGPKWARPTDNQIQLAAIQKAALCHLTICVRVCHRTHLQTH